VNIFINDKGETSIDEEEYDKINNSNGYKTNDVTTRELVGGDGQQRQKEIDEARKLALINKQNEIVKELSDKLDALLEILFEHIQSRCCSNNNNNGSIEIARQTFYELLPIFESSILTTHKSKFVQYCIFLTCGLEVQMIQTESHLQESSNDYNLGEEAEEAILNREFASALLNIIVDPYRATTTRQSAACYLASFISRASFVGPETVCESVSALLRWAEAYIESLGSYAVRATDARTQSDFHSLFYTVCQAAFYIMSFQGQAAVQFYRKTLEKQNNTADVDTMSTEDELTLDAESINLSTERWTFLCGHELQPLRFCLESVREEFLHVAHFFGLIEESILKKLVTDAKRQSSGRINKKAASRKICTAATLELRRQTGGVGGLGQGGDNPLKSFFPFDPLLLEQSHNYIEPFYKYWDGPVEEDDVLAIDEGQQDGEEATFEMDDTMEALAGASREADDHDAEEDDDVDEEGDSDSDDDDDESATDQSEKEDDDAYGTPEVSQHKLLQQKAWTETLKRPRSFSMENGSW
jgi:RNA polymerase I-specific transcription initiation factor RRN3